MLRLENFIEKIIKKKTILVFANKEKKNNLLIYDAINKLLNQNNIKAPRLINANYKKNFIEIEDLGDKTIYDILQRNKKKKYKYYFQILKILSKLQEIKKNKITTFNNSIYRIPLYSKNRLYNESKLFLDWYVPNVIKKKNLEKINKKISIYLKKLINNLKCKNKVFVHRDFHISNMMYYKNSIFIIDSQDAVYGNIAYDLASLIDDVRLKTSLKDKKKLFKKFVKIIKYIDEDKLKNDFEILSVLRNLKIIGIFTRLSIRDKKNKYLKLIPDAWRLIEQRIKNNKKFADLKNILNKNFSKKIRRRYEN